MRTRFRRTLCIRAVRWGAAIGFIAASGLSAQIAGEPKAAPAAPYRFDIAVTYGATSSDVVGGSTFWMQGGDLQAHGRIYRGLGAVADFSGLHKGNIQSSGVGLDLVTAAFGPRYTWQPAHARYDFYGQALVGIAHGFNSDFPTQSGSVSSSQSLAFKLGGGLNIVLTPRISLRALEASWLRTQFPNSSTGVQGSCQLNTGFVLRF